MAFKFYVLLFSTLIFCLSSFCQQPKYTPKSLVAVLDTSEFKLTGSKKDGFIRSYVETEPQIFDIDDDSTTFIMGTQHAVVCFEGQMKYGAKIGIFTAWLIDSANHRKRYKIYEQTYENDKLNGPWRTYSLKGTLVNEKNFKNDSIDGLSTDYWIDGKSIMDETEYFNGHNKFIYRTLYKNGKIKQEVPYENDKTNGTGKKYYEDGTLQEVVQLTNDQFDGTRKYFFPNGQVWIEEIYKRGKDWTIVANYTSNGKKRDAGTLHEGNGTVIFYDEDGSVRETKTFVNGEEKQ